MRYLGVKTKLLDWIFLHVHRHAQALGLKPSETIFLDACTGTATVAARAATEGFQVVANDLLPFAAHVARGKLCLPVERLSEVDVLLYKISKLPPVEGHFFREYSAPKEGDAPEGARRYFVDTCAKQIDAIREFIQQVSDPVMQSYLYYCLIEAIGQVDNTTGTHGAFLKSWKDSQTKELALQRLVPIGATKSRIYNMDIHDLLIDPEYRKFEPEDILYLDPPYVPREYAAYYHLYSAAVAPKDPVVRGITGLPEDYPRSEFCRPADTVEAFLERIIKRTQARLILVSYSSDSTVPLHHLTATMFKGGCQKVEVQVMPYLRYKTDSSEEREYNQEFLQEFLVIGIKQTPELDFFF
jgi:adenine-specific DNA methylase